MAAAEEASEASTTVEDLLAAKAAALQDCSHKSAVALLRELRGEAALPQHVQQERSYLPPAFTGGGQPKSNGGAGNGYVAWKSGVRRVYDSDSGSSSDETCSPLRLLTARAVEIENGHTSAEALLRELKQNADAKQRLAPVSIRPMASEPPPPAM
jgi:outer membrane PBP1 activator LpoA protein